MSFHPEILPDPQIEALRTIAPAAESEGFYLAGGTALAIRFGHRQSIDFDWFRGEGFDPLLLRGRIPEIEVTQTGRDTLHGSAKGVSVSFLGYPYPLLEPPILWPEFGIRLASVKDIACMKLAAISQRGARKDFLDLAAIGETGLALPEMLDLFRRKYSVRDIGHVLVALAYFDDAEREPMPRMLVDTDWETVKSTLRDWVRATAH